MISFSNTITSVFLGATTLLMGGALGSNTEFAGYAPGSDVDQHSYIDLDMQEMLTHIGNTDFNLALNIYANGGNSGGRATFILRPGTITTPFESGKDKVVEQGNGLGYVKSLGTDVNNNQVLVVTYTSRGQFPCKAGGVASPVTTGCFTADANMTINSLKIQDLSIISVTQSYRTIRGFSTAAQAKMEGQRVYQQYRAFFTSGSYADDLVTSALEDGNSKFQGLATDMRQEVAKKGAVYLNIWMYVIREMEDAINDCKANCEKCNDDPVHAWDEAVAFYVGSLGKDGDKDGQSSGNLLYALADKRCKNYGTCDSTATSRVNSALLVEFNKGKRLLDESKCTEVIPIKDRIVELMSVPLVQGALRYASKVDIANGKAAGSASSKEVAEGYIFAQAILPRLAVCNGDDAKLIARNQGLYATSDSAMKDGFDKVRQAYESNYACLGITCEDIGGLLNADKSDYIASFPPCETPAAAVQETEVLPVYAIALIAVFAVLCGVTIIVAIVLLVQKNALSNKYKKLSVQADEGTDNAIKLS